MTAAIPLQQGVKTPLHSLIDQGSTSCVSDYDMPKDNDNFMEMGSICNDKSNVNPTTFVTGPEVWPAHLQLKVKTHVVVSSFMLQNE